MAQIVKEITVDVAKRNLFQAIVAKQYDSNSRFLKVTLTNEGTTIPVDTTSTITINAKRADGLSKLFDGVVNDDGTVTVPLTSWMLELDDTVECDISVIDTASRKLTSTSFELEVETASCSNEAIEGDERYDLLLNLIGSVTEVSDDCRRAIQEANEAAAKANEAAAKANEAAGGDDSMGEGGYAPPQDGIPLTDLSQEIRLLLERAATAMQTGTDIRTTGIEVDTYANSSAAQYGGVRLETEDTGYGGTPVLKLISMATGNKVRITGLAEPQNETEAATMGYVIAYVAQNLNKGVDGADAVIWSTDVAPTSSNVFVIYDLNGPADAVPSPGQMIISSYTGRGYFITAVDEENVTIADYSVQVTGPAGKNGTPGANGGYYTIDVEQLNSQNVKISFTPSNEGMPTILPVVITLPQGPQGEPGDAYVLTEADKEEIAAMASPDATPDYVVEEAEAVIDRVLAAQGENTFTVAVITDLHDEEGGYTDTTLHACQAMKYIDSRVKLDAVAVLGDYTDGYPSTGIANAMGDFKAINGVLDKLRFTTNLRQQGNHDYYPDNIPITRQLIQYFSDGVVWGSRTGGYYHRDFEDHKLRVLCPNTNENNPMDTSTNKPSSSISMTEQQLRWFIDTLDLSVKSDAEEWQILILTHHPLDYWESSGKYSLSYIVNAYQTGGSWSGNGVSCNFAGKNKAKLICNIHGHIHNLLMDQMFLGNSNSTSKIKVYRLATPNSCNGRENQYTGAWGEAAAYTKTRNSGKDTAFVVYCIDLSAHKVTAVCYGAGYDRVLNYLEETAPEIYAVTNHLTNVTSSNAAATVTEGQSYTATLTPAGSTLQSVTVVMGGVDITDTAYSNGQININPVTGNLVITAVGAAPVVYVNQIPVSINTDGGVFNGKGWKENIRLGSDGNTKDAADDDNITSNDMATTGFIPVKAGDIVYMNGIKASLTATGGKSEFTYLALYSGSFVSVATAKFNMIGSNLSQYEYRYDSFITDPATGYVTSFRIVDRYGDMGANGGYLRISAEGLNGNAIITVNQPIE